MIIRVVKLYFASEHIEAFKQVFEESSPVIHTFDGCSHVALWQDIHDPCRFFTYSHWESEDALNAYRHSDFFKATWAKTKALFADKPEAWSVRVPV